MVNAIFRRIPLVCGNWKLNGSVQMVDGLVKMLNEYKFDEKVQIGVAPSAVHLKMVRDAVRGEVMVGAQDCWVAGSGAFTGETSADMLRELGIEFTIVGHSERRGMGEWNDLIGKKAAYATKTGLTVIGCIGEKLEHRESNKTMDVITEQMQGYVENLKEESQWASMVLAYEPVWAIGTGKTASPDQAQEVHGELRRWLKQNISEKVAAETRILYGGSVTAENCDELIKKEDIDGFLVGGASLKPQFLKICDAPLSLGK